MLLDMSKLALPEVDAEAEGLETPPAIDIPPLPENAGPPALMPPALTPPLSESPPPAEISFEGVALPKDFLVPALVLQ